MPKNIDENFAVNQIAKYEEKPSKGIRIYSVSQQEKPKLNQLNLYWIVLLVPNCFFQRLRKDHLLLIWY